MRAPGLNKCAARLCTPPTKEARSLTKSGVGACGQQMRATSGRNLGFPQPASAVGRDAQGFL